MSMNLPQRRLIPKWRPTAATLDSPEAVGVHKNTTQKNIPSFQDFDEAKSLWEKTSHPGILGDILGFSIYPELKESVANIAKNALKSGVLLTSVQTQFINELFTEEVSARQTLVDEHRSGDAVWKQFQGPIQKLRALLRMGPDNPLALLDFAQLQAAVGKSESAGRAITTALAAAPNNRTVLRTAARFFVHDGQADRAHALIQSNPRTKTDPWLMASEIALADVSNRSSMMISKGKRFLIDNKKIPAMHISELAGAIAMKELNDGSLKMARESLRKALVAPNDNVVAQAIDMQKRFGLVLDGANIEAAIEGSSEAQVLQAWLYGSPNDAFKSAIDWHNQEPFSSRPIQIITSVLAYQEDFDLARQWLSTGLLADPNDKGLHINMAFVQARQGDGDGSLRTIKKLRSIEKNAAESYGLATEGLIAYQNGNFTAGDHLYSIAVDSFMTRREFPSAAFCRLNQLIFAESTGHPDIEVLVKSMGAVVKDYWSPDCAMLLKIRSNINLLTAEKKINSEPQRRLSQWVFDPGKNSLVERSGITVEGAPGLIVLPRGG